MRTAAAAERFKRKPATALAIAPIRGGIVKIIRALEAYDTRAIRVLMASAGAMLVAAALTTNVVSFLLALATAMACWTMLEENYRRGAYGEILEEVTGQRRRPRRVNPRR
jgi:hypothetical protein